MATVVQYILSLKDQFSGTLNDIDNKTRSLDNSFSGLKSTIATTFGIGAITMFGKSIIDVGSKVENATTGLTTMLKSAEGATSVISSVMEDAMKTPFSFESLLDANKALISAGENSETARKNVLNLANAISATGGTDEALQRMVVNMQQIKNVGFAEREDIKQFAYAGINIFKALEEAGISSARGTQVSYEQLTLALQKAHEEGGIYYNGLENMANNTSVKVSNLSDAIFQLKVKMFNDLKPAITEGINMLSGLIGKLGEAWKWYRENREMVNSFVVGLGSAIVAVKVMIPLMQGLAVATMTTVSPMLALGVAVTALGTAYMYASTQQEQFQRSKEDWNKKQYENETNALQEDLAEKVKRGVKEKEARKQVADFQRGLINKEIEQQRELGKQYDFQGYLKGSSDKEKQKALDLRNQSVERIITLEEKLKAVSEFEKGSTESTNGIKNPTMSTMANTSKTKAISSNTSRSQATGNKAITINVSIKDLIGTNNMNITNVKESINKIQDMVVGALTGAVNDFQLIVE